MTANFALHDPAINCLGPKLVSAMRAGKAREANDYAHAVLIEAQKAGIANGATETDVMDSARDFIAMSAALDAQTAREDAGVPGALQSITLRNFMGEQIVIEFLFDDLFRRGWLYCITGATGSGKTAVGVPLALCCAVSRAFVGSECSGGPVLYVASENPDDVRARFAVALERDRMPESVLDNVHVLPASFVLAEKIAQLIAMVERIGAVLVIVDTDQAVSLAGSDDENSNGERMAHAKRLRILTRSNSRPTVVDLCHPRKAVNSPDDLVPRGGGAFLNEADGNLRLWRNGDISEMTSDPNKFRGAPLSFSFKSEMVTTAKVVDTKGRLIPIPYFRPITDDEAAAASSTDWTEENRLIFTMAGDPKGTQATWAASCQWFGLNGKPRKDKVNRLLKRLEKATPSLVRQVRDGRWGLTPAGEKEAAKS